jgi:beta-mannosidase
MMISSKRLSGIFLAGIMIFFSCNKLNKDVMEISIQSDWKFRQAGTEQWMSAKVPGCVHTDLLDNKKIPDPFYRTNEKGLQWIDKVDWEYQTIVMVDKKTFSKKHIELHFKGLDTYAKVFVNDSLLLVANNMFREWKADCKKFLREGQNTLRINFDSPIRKGIELYDKQGYEVTVSENDLSELGGVGKKRVSVFCRKAGYHFGWDWGPRLISSGIWRPVILRAWNDASIRYIQIEQHKIEKENARLCANIELEADRTGNAKVVLYVNNQEKARQDIELKSGGNNIPVSFSIQNPSLWWPNGYGEHPLYSISVKIFSNDLLLDEKYERIGIRTVEVVQQPDSTGKSFYFRVNGVPVFMKGANYIPQDIFVTRVTRDQYEYMLNSAVDANMNMLRVWGGGVYGDDMLYDLCDEKGIMVWQDFMFACSLFPDYPGYFENVKQEAIDNVKRMRNHPCMALWCGNNECLDALTWTKNPTYHKDKKFNVQALEKTYDTMFHSILPSVVKAEDSTRFYWPSSPCAAQGVPSNWKSGDTHYWGVWWGKEPFSNYQTKIGRFMSEYGYQSFPELQTVKKFSIESDWDIYSEVMKHHQRSSIGNGTIDLYLNWYYNKPKDFVSFLYVNQVLQAEGVKTAMESHRVNKPFCMGTLFWQIDDCWPVASWSGIDYYGNWKALHYFTKKAYEPVHVTLVLLKNKLSAYIVSDLMEAQEGTLQLKLLSFDGAEKWSKKIDAKVDSNKSAMIFEISEKELTANNDTCDLVLQAQFINNGRLISENHIFFVVPKNLKLPDIFIKPEIDISADEATIIIHSDKLAKNVYLICEKGSFSDNYFDLLPGETKEVKMKIRKGDKISKEDITVRTLKDTY